MILDQAARLEITGVTSGVILLPRGAADCRYDATWVRGRWCMATDTFVRSYDEPLFVHHVGDLTSGDSGLHDDGFVLLIRRRTGQRLLLIGAETTRRQGFGLFIQRDGDLIIGNLNRRMERSSTEVTALPLSDVGFGSPALRHVSFG
jgi:hypothetical protein